MWPVVTAADAYYSAFGVEDAVVATLHAHSQRPGNVLVDVTGPTQGHRPAAVTAAHVAACENAAQAQPEESAQVAVQHSGLAPVAVGFLGYPGSYGVYN